MTKLTECRVPEVKFSAFVYANKVRFSVEQQSFTLDYDPDTPEELYWMRDRLDAALSKIAAAQEPEKAELSEQDKAFMDQVKYGCSFMKDGKRISPEDVIETEKAEPATTTYNYSMTQEERHEMARRITAALNLTRDMETDEIERRAGMTSNAK